MAAEPGLALFEVGTKLTVLRGEAAYAAVEHAHRLRLLGHRLRRKRGFRCFLVPTLSRSLSQSVPKKGTPYDALYQLPLPERQRGGKLLWAVYGPSRSVS